MGNAALKYCLRVMCNHNGLSKGNASSQKNVASGNVDNASSQGNKAPGSAASQCVVNRQCDNVQVLHVASGSVSSQ